MYALTLEFVHGHLTLVFNGVYADSHLLRNLRVAETIADKKNSFFLLGGQQLTPD